MAQFANDTFTDANGVLLENHTGEIGATWVEHGNSFGTSIDIQSNRADGNGNDNIYYASGDPINEGYSVQADVIKSGAASDTGVLCRVNTATQNWYSLTITTTSVRIFKNASTNLQTRAVTLADGTYTLIIECTGTSTTNLKGFLQRKTDNFWLNNVGVWQSEKTHTLEVNDSSSPNSDKGKAGVQISASRPLDNFRADDITTARQDKINEILLILKLQIDKTSFKGRIKWDNVATKSLPPAGHLPWLRAVLRHGASFQATLSGATGKRRFRRTGTLVVQCFDIVGQGLAPGGDLPKIVQDAYEGKTSPTGVIFRNVSINEIGPDGDFFQTNVVINFEYDEIK